MQSDQMYLEWFLLKELYIPQQYQGYLCYQKLESRSTVQDGEVQIDIAIIAAPTADSFGNATGDRGPAACGLLGFALADSQYADKVVVDTDNIVPFPCIPWQIHGNYVDYVVEDQNIVR